MPKYNIFPSQKPFSLSLSLKGDKSLSHRALMLAAMAQGRSRLSNLSLGEDVHSTRLCLERLGAKFSGQKEDLEVEGWGERGPLSQELSLDCGNSGTTMRLLSAVVSSGEGCYTLTGDPSLSSRPMKRIRLPLEALGGSLRSLNQNEKAPLMIQGARGKLRGGSYESPLASAQVKSCFLLAALYAKGSSHYREPHLSRDHTERMLCALGVELKGSVVQEGLTIEPIEKPWQGFEWKVPGDISSACFWVAATLLVPQSSCRIENVSLNPSRTKFLELLKKMGAEVDWKVENEDLNEPTGTVTAHYAPLKAIEVGEEDVPGCIDELPLLALLATQAKGTTVISGAQDLRHKESDRISCVVEGLTRLGVELDERQDGFEITGPQKLVGGCDLKVYDDHRLAMTWSIAGLVCQEPVTILEGQWACVSYPKFWDHFPAKVEVDG